MANVQKQFNEFHDKIRLKGYSDNKKLREKRDLLINDLNVGLKKQEKEDDAPPLSFEKFDQGSYAIHTGTKPIHKEDDYDIDVGLIFDLNAKEHQEYLDDPVKLKKRIRDALDKNNRTVQIKEPCVRVQYKKDGTDDYHVDLANYKNISGTDELDLSRGKEHSSEGNKKWDRQDPKGLIDKINKAQSNDEDRAQMRRCIRYLKRWRDRKFSTGVPVSIALTVAAYKWFVVDIDIDGEPSDQSAMKKLVESMLSNKQADGRLVITLPVTPYNDLLAEMTDKQMEDFFEKLEDLKTTLEDSISLKCPHEVCKKLQKQFGDEFPVPDKEETGKKGVAPVIVTGVSS